MKAIKTLRLLINVLFFTLIAVIIFHLLFWPIVYFYSDSLPFYLQGFRMILNSFSTLFDWKFLLVPLSTAINFILFVLSIFYLRKCIKPFIVSDFYTEVVTKNLKKSGILFVFIGLSTILIQLISTIYVQNVTQNIIEPNMIISFLNLLAAAIDLKSTFLIIIGLFFLLFSESFKNAETLKQENDLTI
ncbi:DUF2975 domain-containing protein [Flavobacteriaceae bacterium XHP0103]|uniref:hypothetical protein n=1 Tax=Marixanthotalea marina TaxID=2844359 RepID=UPI002989F312|nr:hypothetical protein [Marixanthotalea marina]MBU3820800.1 DUF2975 domain-containing protein [Marixanthotalea marina]